MSDDKKKDLSKYQRQIHLFGRITNLIAVIALLAVPLILTLVSDVKLDVGVTFKAFMGIFSLMGVLLVVEFMTYAPILGAGATYLTFITGNTINLKLPAAISSVELAGVEMNSPEADVISTIAVAVSSLVTIIILLIGLIGFSFMLPVLQSPAIKPAFDNLMPALMGALAAPILVKDLRTSSVPVILGVALTIAIGFAAFAKIQAILMPFFLIITVLWRYVLYRIDKKKEESLKG